MLGKAIRNLGLRREEVVTSVIVGAKQVEQPERHVATVDVALTTEQFARLDVARSWRRDTPAG